MVTTSNISLKKAVAATETMATTVMTMAIMVTTTAFATT